MSTAPMPVAVAGESAGGNLAFNVTLAARDQKLPMPVHERLKGELRVLDNLPPIVS